MSGLCYPESSEPRTFQEIYSLNLYTISHPIQTFITDSANHSVRPVVGFNGILGGTYGFVQVTVPECLPDRVEIVSYVVEFAYLCDGIELRLPTVSAMRMCTDGCKQI